MFSRQSVGLFAALLASLGATRAEALCIDSSSCGASSTPEFVVSSWLTGAARDMSGSDNVVLGRLSSGLPVACVSGNQLWALRDGVGGPMLEGPPTHTGKICAGAGNDTIVVASVFYDCGVFTIEPWNYNGETLAIYGQLGNDDLRDGSGTGDRCGGGGDDNLSGNAGADTLDGWTGNDYLSGGSSNDQLWGWDGADQLYDASGNDRLRSEEGNDVCLHDGDGIYLTFDCGPGIDSSFNADVGIMVNCEDDAEPTCDPDLG
jgi:hypothetical protein